MRSPRITRITPTTVTVPLEAPLRHANGCHWGRFVRTVVEVETDAGITGLGEMGGIDPVHFGLIMVLNLMIGLLTPPVGMVLFVLQKVAKLSFEATVRAVFPWMLPLLVTLAIITYVPALVLWLPNLLYK